jgi:hypothetical protein
MSALWDHVGSAKTRAETDASVTSCSPSGSMFQVDLRPFARFKVSKEDAAAR